MRLLLTVGYQKLLFGKGTNVSEIINSLDGAALIEEKYVEGHTKIIVRSPSAYESNEIVVKLINDDSVLLPEIKDDKLDILLKVQKKRDESESENYDLKSKIKELEAKIIELTPSAKKEEK